MNMKQSTLNFVDEIKIAEKRIRPHVRQTYLDYSPHYSSLGKANVYLKLENLQHTGSFKLRGVLNKLLSMTPQECEKGVVVASTGNHGAAFAYAVQNLKLSGSVFVPENASVSKIENIKRWGGTVHQYGTDSEITETYARNYAVKYGKTYVSPYNDYKVASGQGTIGVELVRQLHEQRGQGSHSVDAVFVSVGGGGLIAGVGHYVKHVYPEAKIIGCSPENSAVMIHSLKAGQILQMSSLDTLSDGTAGGVEADAITFDLCRQVVDDCVLVSEEEIKNELNAFMSTHHQMIEGAAAVALAGYVKRKDVYKDKNIVIIVCGANISLTTMAQVIRSTY